MEPKKVERSVSISKKFIPNKSKLVSKPTITRKNKRDTPIEKPIK